MTTENTCRVCPVYGQNPAHWEEPYVCHACQARMARQLVQISDEWLSLDAAPGGGHRDRVTGTREAPLGVRVDVLDQMLPVGERSDETIRHHIGDQIGETPAGVVLDLIVSEWLEARRRDGHQERRPNPSVAGLTTWLRDRLGWACAHLPESIDGHADEIRQLAGRLRALNGHTKTKGAEPLPATPCKHCGHIALVRIDGAVTCTHCSQYSGQWVDAIAGAITKISNERINQ